MYEQLAEIQRLLWKNDDMMLQDTLFTLQNTVADLILEVALKEGKGDKLVNDFPWLYRANNS